MFDKEIKKLQPEDANLLDSLLFADEKKNQEEVSENE